MQYKIDISSLGNFKVSRKEGNGWKSVKFFLTRKEAEEFVKENKDLPKIIE